MVKKILGNKIEIIYGIVKLNKSGVKFLENIINKFPDYKNYFIYTSKNALNGHTMYFLIL